MHYLAPIPILLGVAGIIAGLLWLLAAGSENDDGPEPEFVYIFGLWYIALRACRQLVDDPMSILPAFGILAVSAALIGVGIMML